LVGIEILNVIATLFFVLEYGYIPTEPAPRNVSLTMFRDTEEPNKYYNQKMISMMQAWAHDSMQSWNKVPGECQLTRGRILAVLPACEMWIENTITYVLMRRTTKI